MNDRPGIDLPGAEGCLQRQQLHETLVSQFTLRQTDGRLGYRDGVAGIHPDCHMFVARHGQTHINQRRNTSGWSNSGRNDALNQLTRQGQQQAATLAEELLSVMHDRKLLNKAEPPVIICSSLDRAQQTAEPLLGQLKSLGVRFDHYIDSRFDEIDLGDWNNRWVDDLPTQSAAMRRFRFEADAAMVAPGGESFVDLLTRVASGIRWVNEVFERRCVLLFSHATAISAIRMLARDNFFVDERGLLVWTGRALGSASWMTYDLSDGRWCIAPALQIGG